MRFKPYHIFYFLFLISQLSFGQNPSTIDSLNQVYSAQPDDSLKFNSLNALYNAYLYNDPQKALHFARVKLELAKRLKHTDAEAHANYYIGVYYNNADIKDTAAIYYQKALNYYQTKNDISQQAMVNHAFAILEYQRGHYDIAIDMVDKNLELYKTELIDTSDIARAYNLRSGINSFKGNYKMALEDALAALAVHERINEPIGKADILNSLGSLEAHFKNFEKSIAYNKDAIVIYQAHNDKSYEAQAANDIGNAYFYLKKYDRAQSYLLSSIALAKEVKSLDLEGTALNNLGKVYLAIARHDKAIECLKQSLAIHEKTGSKNKIVETLNQLGKTYNQKQLALDALPLLNRAIHLADSIAAKDNLRQAYYQRSATFELLGDFKSSKQDYVLFNSISDSVFNIAKSQQIEELRSIHETEKKEKEILVQQSQIASLEKEKKITFLQRGLLALGLITALFFLYAISERVKKERLLKEHLASELDFKKKELTTHALHLAKKNEVLESLKTKALALKADSNSETKGYQSLIHTINFDLQDDNNWENFSRYFEEVHKGFNSKAQEQFPDITANDLRLMSLLKMNLSSKEIANILSISSEGIKKARYRLRKKLELSTEESLEAFVLAFA